MEHCFCPILVMFLTGYFLFIRESASTVALAGSIGNAGQRLEVQADMVSAQRYSISSLSDKSGNVSLNDEGGASTRALAGSVFSCKVRKPIRQV